MRVLIDLCGRHRVWARRNTSHDYNSEVEWPPSSPDLSCWSVFGCGVSILKNILSHMQGKWNFHSQGLFSKKGRDIFSNFGDKKTDENCYFPLFCDPYLRTYYSEKRKVSSKES